MDSRTEIIKWIELDSFNFPKRLPYEESPLTSLTRWLFILIATCSGGLVGQETAVNIISNLN